MKASDLLTARSYVSTAHSGIELKVMASSTLKREGELTDTEKVQLQNITKFIEDIYAMIERETRLRRLFWIFKWICIIVVAAPSIANAGLGHFIDNDIFAIMVSATGSAASIATFLTVKFGLAEKVVYHEHIISLCNFLINDGRFFSAQLTDIFKQADTIDSYSKPVKDLIRTIIAKMKNRCCVISPDDTSEIQNRIELLKESFE
jgi:hypothetical protein